MNDVVTAVGSGVNGRRRKLSRLLADPTVTTIVVEHRDRLACFGIEHLDAVREAHGRRLVVLDDGATRPLSADVVRPTTSQARK